MPSSPVLPLWPCCQCTSLLTAMAAVCARVHKSMHVCALTARTETTSLLSLVLVLSPSWPLNEPPGRCPLALLSRRPAPTLALPLARPSWAAHASPLPHAPPGALLQHSVLGSPALLLSTPLLLPLLVSRPKGTSHPLSRTTSEWTWVPSVNYSLVALFHWCLSGTFVKLCAFQTPLVIPACPDGFAGHASLCCQPLAPSGLVLPLTPGQSAFPPLVASKVTLSMRHSQLSSSSPPHTYTRCAAPCLSHKSHETAALARTGNAVRAKESPFVPTCQLIPCSQGNHYSDGL